MTIENAKSIFRSRTWLALSTALTPIVTCGLLDNLHYLAVYAAQVIYRNECVAFVDNYGWVITQ